MTDRGPTARGRFALGVAAAVVVLAVTVVLSLGVGSKELSLQQLLDSAAGNGSAYVDAVLGSRVPRTVLGLIVGAALGVAGGVMQGVTRNPLADPGLFGVNAGAAAAIVTAVGFAGAGAGAYVWLALLGAAVAVVAVYALGTSRGGGSATRIVLAGAVVTAVFSAYVQAITLSFPEVFDAYRFWVVGSLAGRSLEQAWLILPFVGVGLVLALALAPALNALALGDDIAASLGSSPAVTRVLAGVAVALLAGAATAGIGPILFVGLAVPHIARALSGPDHRLLLPLCLLLGPALLLASDVLGRVIARPDELMVGVMTAFVGAPALFVALRRLRGERR
ncbi:iron complex transport system permease protein [Paramicrobacterium humi]|uniref:Iron complex transport system permease protein n=1 Tax=Paramicrobacterium humi TaxID=640635 RepID=A0A1H4PAI0_9MICO|nr:iron ABC transporter permease [Microbacterium humi]SEC04002.1 iron complex transport system permease protein [Microbacterium humi]